MVFKKLIVKGKIFRNYALDLTKQEKRRDFNKYSRIIFCIPETLGNEPAFVNDAHILTLKQIIEDKKIEEKKFLDFMGVDSIEHILADEYEKALKSLKMAKGKVA